MTDVAFKRLHTAAWRKISLLDAGLKIAAAISVAVFVGVILVGAGDLLIDAVNLGLESSILFGALVSLFVSTGVLFLIHRGARQSFIAQAQAEGLNADEAALFWDGYDWEAGDLG